MSNRAEVGGSASDGMNVHQRVTKIGEEAEALPVVENAWWTLYRVKEFRGTLMRLPRKI